jgi:hypothetical protein
MVLNEADTRIKLIDPVLERVGWKVKGSYVKEEVNPVKSKFQKSLSIRAEKLNCFPSQSSILAIFNHDLFYEILAGSFIFNTIYHKLPCLGSQ